MTIPYHKPIIIGSRGSPLALVQAEMVKSALSNDGYDAEIKVIRTTGDHVLDRPLSEIGGKGLFTKELDEALLSGSIDVAVHSMKDVPTFLPDGIHISAILPRADVRDVLLSPSAETIDKLSEGTRLGTSSLRRKAQLKRFRPDLIIVPLRGNVATRISKIDEGHIDATLLAKAGLDRLGLNLASATALSTEDMLPAVAQAAIGIATRVDDPINAIVARQSHLQSELRVGCERAVLATINGDCHTPIGVLAEVFSGEMRVTAKLGAPDGEFMIEASARGTEEEFEQIGRQCGMILLDDPRATDLVGSSQN